MSRARQQIGPGVTLIRRTPHGTFCSTVNNGALEGLKGETT
jgi:hypothetical protein